MLVGCVQNFADLQQFSIQGEILPLTQRLKTTFDLTLNTPFDLERPSLSTNTFSLAASRLSGPDNDAQQLRSLFQLSPRHN